MSGMRDVDGPPLAARRWAATGAFLLGLGVVLGAFGAHGLEARLPEARLETYHTAVRYHLTHALGLLLAAGWGGPGMRAAPWLALGILLFSGSLYLLALTGIGLLGAVAPFGGAAWVAAWTLLGLGLARR